MPPRCGRCRFGSRWASPTGSKTVLRPGPRTRLAERPARAGQKIGGILSVARIAGNDAWVGCGAGLNVTRPPHDADLSRGRTAADLSQRSEPPAACAQRCSPRSCASSIARSTPLRDPAAVVSRWERRAQLPERLPLSQRRRRYRARRGRPAHRPAAARSSFATRSGEHAIDMADVRVTGRARDPARSTAQQ